MSHQDDHHHDEGHKMTAESKMLHLIKHWIHHNEDHMSSYREWASRASEMGLEEVAGILDEVADDARVQNDRLQKALALMENVTPSK
jgi:hypothetical protein